MKNTLRLKVGAAKRLQAKHGITNIFAIGADVEKISPEFMGDFYYEASRSFENPPTMEEIEDMDVRDLMEAFKECLGDDAGKSPEA